MNCVRNYRKELRRAIPRVSMVMLVGGEPKQMSRDDGCCTQTKTLLLLKASGR